MYSDPEGYAVVQRRLDVLAKMQGDVVLAVRPPLPCMACLDRRCLLRALQICGNFISTPSQHVKAAEGECQ